MIELKKHIYDESNGLWYELVGDYYFLRIDLIDEAERSGDTPDGIDRNDGEKLHSSCFENLILRGELLSCGFNDDTACMEVILTDGSMYVTNTTVVENAVAENMYQRAELNWLIDYAPLEYVQMAICGKLIEYVQGVPEHRLIE